MKYKLLYTLLNQYAIFSLLYTEFDIVFKIFCGVHSKNLGQFAKRSHAKEFLTTSWRTLNSLIQFAIRSSAKEPLTPLWRTFSPVGALMLQ